MERKLTLADIWEKDYKSTYAVERKLPLIKVSAKKKLKYVALNSVRYSSNQCKCGHYLHQHSLMGNKEECHFCDCHDYNH